MSTLKSTFFLKNPQGRGKKSNHESLILFSCYFKLEEKKFVYSTGERIAPKSWDFKNRQPLRHGSNRSKLAAEIATQINRYKEKFEEIQARCKSMDEDFTSQVLKDEFDKSFKRSPNKKNLFFEAYDAFMDYKQKIGDWSPSTIIRYNNIKGILKDFERERKYLLTFNTINNKFHAEFTDYCMNEREHINNTYSRNLGLFKTFMLWSFKNGYTYKEDFKDFKKKKVVVTNQLALSLEDLQKLMAHEFKLKRLERVRDIFVFACVTGMRFGELKFITFENIVNGELHLKEEKDAEKVVRRIPLNDIAKFILRKYDYDLPLIANQKHNEYIKEVFEIIGYTWDVEKVTTKGKENIREKIRFSERISSHTARRTFITMMKKKGISDKLIASITGHKDMKTLNQYYQVDDEAKSEAVNDVFKVKFELLKKVD
ncbi:site-specific integrase [Croceitalea rosinachiae]|uniref:Tyrosine-type recombinase/integrase n=1 Tax=Croceitalea rosinachiae TaxID=3075596 RepID=A0ABU3ACU1_9FLAO|nr:tyrosine-type recombinase/integrase [Croceitalea sp. F388]MDT0608007.1 tyrosine-type recombinase/integrase [Croceitalea sp. F388]